MISLKRLKMDKTTITSNQIKSLRHELDKAYEFTKIAVDELKKSRQFIYPFDKLYRPFDR